MFESDKLYREINQMWVDTGWHGKRIGDARDWRVVWTVLEGWCEQHVGYRPYGGRVPDLSPNATWESEVHIWSHCAVPGGHSLEQARAEYQLSRLILDCLVAP